MRQKKYAMPVITMIFILQVAKKQKGRSWRRMNLSGWLKNTAYRRRSKYQEKKSGDYMVYAEEQLYEEMIVGSGKGIYGKC